MINQNNFLLKEIPKYHPLSTKYTEFWKSEKKKCIEGCWVSGKWMPGNLYYYVNHGKILLNKTASSKVKVLGTPFLRDLEWEFFYNWMEARGFSGFELDEEYTCARKSNPSTFKSLSDIELKLFKLEAPHAFKISGEVKKYINAREYLRKVHSSNLGYPLFENEAKDFMMMGSRGFGKSYSVGVGIIGHEWLFDGQTRYVPPEMRGPDYSPQSASIMCGAGDSKYSSDLLGKTKTAIENLPGHQEVNGILYPSPFSKQYSGSWNSGKQVIAQYKKKVGGSWKNEGSKSTINHRSFSDNPFAANGLRCSVMVFEEIGMFNNLIASRNASVECQMNGAFKFGSMMFLGTGGDMGGGTLDAHAMFYDPESYNLITFDDGWENKGKIAYFVPAYMGLNQYKDDQGNTDTEAARKYLEYTREKLRKGKSGSAALDDELQNRPLVPSEAFLTKGGNIFPVAEIQDRINEIRSHLDVIEKPVTLYYDAKTESGVNYMLDMDKKLVSLNNFPLTDYQKRNRDGCTVVYEFPITDKNGKVPKGMYIIGHDPYASDDTNGDSLGAVYVLKTNNNKQHGYSEIVASFIGRPHQGRKIINETIHKLSLFYGEAKVYFENVRGNTKEYFEKIKRLDLLAAQPQTVLNNKKASWDSSSSTIVYGYPMSNRKMKEEGAQYVRDWLLEVRGLSKDDTPLRNLDLIPDMGLLQELKAFNYEGNFDRVMAFMGCIIGLEETHNRYVQEGSKKSSDTLSFLTDNKRLFGKPNSDEMSQHLLNLLK